MKTLLLGIALVLALGFAVGSADAQITLQGSGVAPTCSGCGSAGVVVGGDQLFRATIGATGTTPFTFTFSTAKASIPICFATYSQNAPGGTSSYYVYQVYESLTAVIVRSSGAAANDVINVFCPRVQ